MIKLPVPKEIPMIGLMVRIVQDLMTLRGIIIKKRYLVILGILVLLFLGMSLFCKKGSSIKIPIRFDPILKYPLLEAKIDKKKYILGLDWGILPAWILEH